MTYYDDAFYGPNGAIEHPEWHIGRIDFQPWPYPSATKLIVKAMNDTVVGGDATFLKKLDPDFVAKDLVNYDYRPQRDEQISGMEEGSERQSDGSLQSHRGAGAVTLGLRDRRQCRKARRARGKVRVAAACGAQFRFGPLRCCGPACSVVDRRLDRRFQSGDS